VANLHKKTDITIEHSDKISVEGGGDVAIKGVKIHQNWF
jgi:hypothetical protein